MKTIDFIKEIINRGAQDDCGAVLFLKSQPPEQDHLISITKLIKEPCFDSSELVFSSSICDLLNENIVKLMFEKKGDAFKATDTSKDIMFKRYLNKINVNNR